MSPFITVCIFTIPAYIVIATILFLCHKFIRTTKAKDIILMILPLITVLFNYIDVYVAIKNGTFDRKYYLPCYPCHAIMWINLTISFLFLIRKKNSRFCINLIEFSSLIGVLCGLIGLQCNIDYITVKSFSDFHVFKGLLAHAALFLNCLYFIVMGYYKPDTKRNIQSCSVGIIIFALCGIYSNLVGRLTSTQEFNAFFLQYPPIDGMPWINCFTITLFGYILLLIYLTIYEKITKKKMWYKSLIEYFKTSHNN